MPFGPSASWLVNQSVNESSNQASSDVIILSLSKKKYYTFKTSSNDTVFIIGAFYSTNETNAETEI